MSHMPGPIFFPFDDEMRARYPKRLHKYLQSEEHARALIEKGQILFRNLTHFRDLENTEDQRSDRMEGAHEHIASQDAKLRVKDRRTGRWLDLPTTNIERPVAYTMRSARGSY